MELFNSCSQEELKMYRDILLKFNISEGNITKIKTERNGRINQTFIIDFATENGYRKLTLQKINTDVFKEPGKLMDNIASVTRHIIAQHKNALYVNRVKKPEVSKYVYFDETTNSYWRLYNYIEANVKNSVESKHDMKVLGSVIGEFSKSLNDFDAKKLCETIPDFHNTAQRYKHFVETMTNDIVACDGKRYNTCKEEAEFIAKRGHLSSIIVNALEQGDIPCRVSHNDTKLNNVLFDKITNEPICLIDLDTVMPGSVLYDFGDAARYGCNTEIEEATTVENVSFDMNYFKALTFGLLKTMKDSITIKELELLVEAVWMMTYELAIRFLDDHIAGNKYFGVEYDGKNLERARVQIALLKDIEGKYDEMKKIVKSVWRNI